MAWDGTVVIKPKSRRRRRAEAIRDEPRASL
jgi:hypothetical protein